MNKTRCTDRERAVAGVRRVLERLHWPRLQMALIVALTGAVGFLSSVFLLEILGVDSLWLRYPASVGIAYVAFLFFLWCWIRSRGDDVLDGLDPVNTAPDASLPGTGTGTAPDPQAAPGGGEFGGGGASASWAESGGPPQTPANAAVSSDPDLPEFDASSLADAADADSLAPVLIALALLAAAVCAAVWFIWAAPVLLAEVLLDAALATGLYRRLRSVRGEHWLKTAIRRTWWPFLAVALAFTLFGTVLQFLAPGADSIGDVIKPSDSSH